MATGIKDKVAIIGMGCSRFGERWDVGTDGLLAEAFDEALTDAGIERGQIEAAWAGSCFDRINVGNSAIPAATALRRRVVRQPAVKRRRTPTAVSLKTVTRDSTAQRTA